MAEKVEWHDNGFSVCGRFAINSEKIRGEPRCYMLIVLDRDLGPVAEMHDLAKYDKRQVKALANRIVREAAARR